MQSCLMDIKVHSDPVRGSLSVIESNLQVPFDIKRVFYIYGAKHDVRRGGHAHYKTRQALISISGSCKVSLDNLKRVDEVSLDAPQTMLLLEPDDWHEMYDFSEDCILLVLASHHYESEDYIHSYDDFCEVYKNEVL
nr:FdtA/QdtA family cupin domain-containing protein [Paenibacillus sp. ACRRX]